MLSYIHELKKYIDPSQLPVEYGGQFVYDHKTWIRNRMVSCGHLHIVQAYAVPEFGCQNERAVASTS